MTYSFILKCNNHQENGLIYNVSHLDPLNFEALLKCNNYLTVEPGSQRLMAMNHHRSLDDRNVRPPVHLTLVTPFSVTSLHPDHVYRVDREIIWLLAGFKTATFWEQDCTKREKNKFYMLYNVKSCFLYKVKFSKCLVKTTAEDLCVYD